MPGQCAAAVAHELKICNGRLPVLRASGSTRASRQMSGLTGKLVQGTCGWGSPHQQLSIYPATCRSAQDRLRVYSQHFGAVEVDTSTYAILPADTVRRWVNSVPEDFAFVFKAFGGFCVPSIAVNTLPQSTRALLSSPSLTRVDYSAMPESAKTDLWSSFNESIEPALSAGKLACVLFQFHLSHTKLSPPILLELRRRLAPAAKMAVEFRCREVALADETLAWLDKHDMMLVASDELEHETAQRDRAQRGLTPGEVRTCLPTRLEQAPYGGALIRVHRRHGTTERVLSGNELEAWAARVRQLPQLRGPLLVLWGTDWEDAAMENSKALAAALPSCYAFDWADSRKKKAKHAMMSMFGMSKTKNKDNGAVLTDVAMSSANGTNGAQTHVNATKRSYGAKGASSQKKAKKAATPTIASFFHKA